MAFQDFGARGMVASDLFPTRLGRQIGPPVQTEPELSRATSVVLDGHAYVAGMYPSALYRHPELILRRRFSEVSDRAGRFGLLPIEHQ